MKASLTNYRQAPRKVRLVADSIRGKRVSDALATLSFMPLKAAQPLRKLVASAAANARQGNEAMTDDKLVIERITVDKGMTYFRSMPRAFGRASPIRKECSHVIVVLGEAAEKEPRARRRTKKDALKQNEAAAAA